MVDDQLLPVQQLSAERQRHLVLALGGASLVATLVAILLYFNGPDTGPWYGIALSAGATVVNLALAARWLSTVRDADGKAPVTRLLPFPHHQKIETHVSDPA